MKYVHIYPYIAFLFCKNIVRYKKNNSIIIMRTQKIIKKIIFAFFTKSLLKKIRKNYSYIIIYNYIKAIISFFLKLDLL